MQPSFARNGVHQVILSVGPSASVPQSPGCPHLTGRLEIAWYVDCRMYRVCGGMGGGTRHGFVKNNSQRGKGHKCKALATGIHTCNNYGTFEDRQWRVVPSTVFKTCAAMSTTHVDQLDQERHVSRSIIGTSTATTAPTPHGHS